MHTRTHTSALTTARLPNDCSVYGDHKRYEENYFGPYPGYYFTGVWVDVGVSMCA